MSRPPPSRVPPESQARALELLAQGTPDRIVPLCVECRRPQADRQAHVSPQMAATGLCLYCLKRGDERQALEAQLQARRAELIGRRHKHITMKTRKQRRAYRKDRAKDMDVSVEG